MAAFEGWDDTLKKYIAVAVETVTNRLLITLADGSDVTLGAKADAPADVDENATARSGISLWKGIKNYLRSIKAQLPAALGQKASAASLSVVVASDQSPIDVDDAPIACAAADVNAPAANTAAVVTYAAVENLKHVITGLAWSYVGGAPTGGNLKVEDVSGTTVFSMDISDQGAGIISFPKPKKSAAANTAMVITLAAGGVGVTGKVSVLNHWTEV